ncbi:hypothetical protein PIROE2DRAFT_13564 [Piromyces sp. E2]|nr:hypothetical protein PIROE2DRAFT_13564 [Piromyces sp. E2]|eukprot:OUM60621.1 hypothetical protein PIROE2DRAFT_13564 [Piromyces sp. E2]
MSSVTTNFDKHSKDEDSLVTSASVVVLPSNFLKFIENWRQRNNILTPSALQPIQQQNVQLQQQNEQLQQQNNNQQMLDDVIISVQENTVTKNEIILNKEEFSKMKQKET